MSTPNPASDLLVSASAHVVGVLAEALALHQWRRQDHCTIAYRAYCHCGWTQDVVGTHKTELALHSEHVASVVAALPNIAIVPTSGSIEVITHAQNGDLIAREIGTSRHIAIAHIGSQPHSFANAPEALALKAEGYAALAARAAGGQA